MKKQQTEELKYEFNDFEISQPLVSRNRTKLQNHQIINEEFDLKSYGKKFLSTLLIFTGTFLTYSSSLIIFQVYFAGLAHISSPLKVLLTLIIGLLFTILGVGKPEKKSEWLLCLSIPLMSLILGFLFTFTPVGWRGELFGWISLILFPLVLFVFYYLKENFTNNEVEK